VTEKVRLSSNNILGIVGHKNALGLAALRWRLGAFGSGT